MDILVKLADQGILIKNVSAKTYEALEKYECDTVPDFTVDSDLLDIEEEREFFKLRNGGDAENTNQDLLEFSALLRCITERMIHYNTLLFHGSAICMNNEVYLFCADSGTGKSTHTRMWREYFGEQAYMINDDKPFVKITDREILVYGSPWSGKHHLDTNTCAPLKAVCFLYRDTENHIEMTGRDIALPSLLKYSYRIKDPAMAGRSLELLINLLDKVPMYTLGCNICHDAARVAYEGMQEDI